MLVSDSAAGWICAFSLLLCAATLICVPWDFVGDHVMLDVQQKRHCKTFHADQTTEGLCNVQTREKRKKDKTDSLLYIISSPAVVELICLCDMTSERCLFVTLCC